jgi:uncharacterized protein (TIGR02186 family)
MTGFHFARRHLANDILFCLSLAMTLICGAMSGYAQTETVEIDTSTREVFIEPDFSGADIVIFGSVDYSKQETSASGYYDIIIIIRGPAETVIARRKERVAGIWINGDSRTFDKAPSFYGILSTRPIEDIADPETLRRFDIDFDPTPLVQTQEPRDPFEKALIRLKAEEGMYVKAPFAVVFLGKSLFRATIRMPAQVSEGNYTAQIYLFHAGKLLSWDKTLLEVRKVGLERYLYTLASDRPWSYGALAVAIAIATGFLGWSLFGRN